MYRVTRSYRVTPRSTKKSKERSAALVAWNDNDDGDTYTSCISYARSFRLDQDVSGRFWHARIYAYPPPRTETRLANWRARAYHYLRYTFHRNLDLSFLSRWRDRKIRENAHRVYEEETSNSRLHALAFGETPLRYYVYRYCVLVRDIYLFLAPIRFIAIHAGEKKKNTIKRSGVHAWRKIESE